MPGKIKYRFAQIDDLEFIYESLKNMATEEGILHRFTQDRSSLERAIFLEDGFVEVLLVEINNHKVGLCLFSKTQRNFHLFQSPGIFVHDLYVLPENRRQGVAAGLVIELRKLAKDRGWSRIEGVVLNQNTEAIKFCNSIADAAPVNYSHIVRIQSRL